MGNEFGEPILKNLWYRDEKYKLSANLITKKGNKVRLGFNKAGYEIEMSKLDTPAKILEAVYFFSGFGWMSKIRLRVFVDSCYELVGANTPEKLRAWLKMFEKNDSLPKGEERR